MNREYIRDLGTIQQYNEKIAKRNLSVSVECMTELLSDLKDTADTINSSAAVDDDDVYRLAKIERQVRRESRYLKIAVDDVDATSGGEFPVAYDKVQKINGEDPRDWFFDFVNIGNCHDCPLHTHIRGNKNKPCGAEECVIKQLCALIGYQIND
jgi:hypothetical protein